jgi:histidyl-tRNA synthetase
MIAVIPFNIDVQAVLPIVGQLRRSGVRVELELRGRKIGKAMGWADSIGADYTFVVGPRDLEAGNGMLKSLSTGEQTAVALDAESIANSL